MQYKIPVQVENEDKIFLNLSIRQLVILMIGLSLAYNVFKTLEKSLDWTIALFPAWLIAIITLFVALFKTSEMTFTPFVLNLFRLQFTAWNRVWSKWVDSFDKITIWYVPPSFDSNQDKLNTKVVKNVHEDVLSKI